MVAIHGTTVAAERPGRGNGDERRWTLRGECPDAVDRLRAFQWEWLRTYGDPDAARWVRQRGKPVTVDDGINREGLVEAAAELLRPVQRRLYRFHDAGEPLDIEVSAVELGRARIVALTALDFLGGQRFAKEVEASVVPDGRPLAICVGSTKPEQVPVYYLGRLEEWTMPGYLGCLRTFPDSSFGCGRRWPRVCPPCRERRTNHRKAARTALRRRAAEATDAID